MKTSFFKSRKILVLLTLFVLMICAIALGACSKHDEEEYYKKYGAYNNNKLAVFNDKNGDGVVEKLNVTASYYIGNLTGEYKTAAEEAIKQANAISGVTMDAKGTSSSDFKFEIYTANNNINAQNAISRSANNIVGSTISFNTKYMSSLNLKQKTHIAIHEMGHTLGLKDLQNTDSKSEFQKYSVMYYSYGLFSKTFDDYQAFDKQNLSEVYG